LIHQGLVGQTTDGYPVLKLNKRSWEIFRGQLKVEVAVEKSPAKTTTVYNPRKAEAELLFERLRKLRKQIADRNSLAPYMIFADSSLKLMAQLRPKNITDFTNLSGVSEYKAQQYGDRFISEILEFDQQHQLPVSIPSKSQMATLQFHQQGLNIAEIAQARGLAVSTISTHLSELMEMNQPVALNKLVTADKQQAIIKAIKQVGDLTLKTLKDSLGEEYSYEEVRLVRGWWRNQQQN
jgi:ATP-dependent DNA helicase RecQ